MKRAVCLLSGGMDSSTVLAVAKKDGYEVHAISVDYGQRAIWEIESARRVADVLGAASFRTVAVDLRALGGSALTDDSIDVPMDRPDEAIGEGVPSTYVPARNTVFLALATAAAETVRATAIYLGVNALDFSGYPDCRPAFIEAFQRVIETGTKQGVEGDPVEIVTPFLASTKADIVRRGTELGVPFELTLSCYAPVEKDGIPAHCGHCDACRLRAKGFAEAGVEDPAPRV